MFVPVYTYCSSDRNIYLNQNSNASSKTKTFAFYKKYLRMNGVDTLYSLYTAALNKPNYYTVMKNRQAKKSMYYHVIGTTAWKCPYLELSWSLFSGIWTECGQIHPMRENTYQKNLEYGHFPRSAYQKISSWLSSHEIMLWRIKVLESVPNGDARNMHKKRSFP